MRLWNTPSSSRPESAKGSLLMAPGPGVTQHSEQRSNGHRKPTEKEAAAEEIGQFIRSIRSDIEAMRSCRKRDVPCCQINLPPLPYACPAQCPRSMPCSSPMPCSLPMPGACVPVGTWHKPMQELSYPATIEVVQPLGDSSLFVKWRVENSGNIAGFEIFLDGYLTNRYFSSIHRAAVICNVTLRCGHRILLRAMSTIKCGAVAASSGQLCPSPSAASNYCHPEASFKQADGSFWTPSIYHYEPSFPVDPSTSLVRFEK